jgi:membrane protein required for colicin V production
MTAFDYTVLAVMVLSVLMGWWRGLVYEAVSFFSWIAAYVVARLFAEDAMVYLPHMLGSDTARLAAAFVALFLATLAAGSVLAWIPNKMIKSAGLARLDGSLGALFGLLRGMVVVVVLVLLAGMTDLPETPMWRDALMSGILQDIAIQTRILLPDELAQKIHYGN